MQDCLTIEDIGKRLNKLTLFALRQVGAAVGVKCPEKYKIAELRLEIINIAKGISVQVPLEKRKIVPIKMLCNGGLADSILKYRETRNV